MLTVYFYYPRGRISIHKDSKCEEIGKHEKPNQRQVNINSNNIKSELERFNKYHFSNNAEITDMWVVVSLDNEVSEIEVIIKIKKILCERFLPFCKAKIEWHSCLN